MSKKIVSNGHRNRGLYLLKKKLINSRANACLELCMNCSSYLNWVYATSKLQQQDTLDGADSTL